ncbi:MAG: four helix bundle protein [Chitinophagales bacterium]
MKENIIQNKSFDFAIKIVELYKELQAERHYDLGRQLLRSGTSIGANIEEAIGGYSKRDFKAKLSISYKEARETKYWLRLLFRTNILKEKTYKVLIKDIEEILRILAAILKNTKLD